MVVKHPKDAEQICEMSWLCVVQFDRYVHFTSFHCSTYFLGCSTQKMQTFVNYPMTFGAYYVHMRKIIQK